MTALTYVSGESSGLEQSMEKLSCLKCLHKMNTWSFDDCGTYLHSAHGGATSTLLTHYQLITVMSESVFVAATRTSTLL